MPTKPHAGANDYRSAFAGLVFPVSRDAIVRRARDSGGIDREVRAILEQLPADRYRTLEELQSAVRAVYLAQGIAPGDVPIKG